MRKILGFAALGVAACILLAVPVARAQGFRTGETATVKSDETLDGTLWAAGNTIDVAGTVQGDVFCAGQNITVSGTVEGDVICAGQNITISGMVAGDIRVAGQTVSITGTVGGSVTGAGQALTLGQDAVVTRDFTTAGGQVTIAGIIGRDLLIGSEASTVGGKVGRNIFAEVTSIKLEPSADVGGKLQYTSRNDALIASGANVAGGVSHSIPTEEERTFNVASANAALAVFMTISLLVIAFALVVIAPQAIDKAAQSVLISPLKAFLLGIGFVFLTPIVVFSLFISVFGIPLALLVLLLWFMVLMVCGPMFAYVIGKLIWRSQDNAILIMVVGCLILMITYFLPVVRGISVLSALTFGSGMTIMAIARALKRPSYNVGSQTHEAK